MSSFGPELIVLRRAEKWIRANGIPTFETVEDIKARHSRMVSSLQKFGCGKLATSFAGCDSAECLETCTGDACHFRTRRRRLISIYTAAKSMLEQSGCKYFVTLIRPEWQVEGRHLHALDPIRIRKQVQQMFRRAGVTIAVGGFEVSLNQQLDGSLYWSGGVHVVCAGVRKSELQKALWAPGWDNCARPVDIRLAENVTRCLGYALKRLPQERREYLADNGRKHRRKMPLNPERLFEHDAWLANIPAGSRTILVGSRQDEHGFICPLVSRAFGRIRPRPS